MTTAIQKLQALTAALKNLPGEKGSALDTLFSQHGKVMVNAALAVLVNEKSERWKDTPQQILEYVKQDIIAREARAQQKAKEK